MCSHPGVDVQLRLPRAQKDKTYYVLPVPGFGTPIICHLPSLVNLLAAVIRRKMTTLVDGEWIENEEVPPKQVRLHLQPFLRAFQKHSRIVHAISLEEVVNHYSGAKRAVYQKCYEEWLDGRRLRKRDAAWTDFVKWEKVVVKPGRKDPPVPRCISPRSPHYNLQLGRFILPMESRIFSMIDGLFTSPTIMKGYNSYELGLIIAAKWAKFHDPVGICLDGDKFDSRVREGLLRYEHSLYMLCCQASLKRMLRRLLEMQINCEGYGYTLQGVFTYIWTCRGSGDMNTSLGNCIIMAAMLFCWLLYYRTKAEVGVNGDDNFVIVEREDAQLLLDNLRWFARVGMSVRLERVAETLEQLEFCQCHPVYDGKQYIMCRNFPEAIDKDRVCLRGYYTPRQLRGWSRSVGECGLAIAHGMPVFSAFYLSLIRFGGDAEPIRDYDDSYGMRQLTQRLPLRRTGSIVDQDARVSFALAFGVEPGLQLALEARYQSDDWHTDVVVDNPPANPEDLICKFVKPSLEKLGSCTLRHPKRIPYQAYGVVSRDCTGDMPGVCDEQSRF